MLAEQVKEFLSCDNSIHIACCIIFDKCIKSRVTDTLAHLIDKTRKDKIELRITIRYDESNLSIYLNT